jgi:hypothetical protein
LEVKVIAILCLGVLLASVATARAAAETVATIRQIHVTRRGEEIEIEVVLSGPVSPQVSVAKAPDRLVLDLPQTTAPARQRRIAVNQNGVQRVRVGLNSADPPVTRVVVDLISARNYGVSTAANTIVLTVLPADSHSKDDGAIPAASASLVGRLWPWQKQENSRRAARKKHAAAMRDQNPRILSTANFPQKGPRTIFKVKYVAEGAAYLDGGRSSGLAKGMKLEVRDPPSSSYAPAASGPAVAELQVVSIAETSAVTDIRNTKRDVKPGDWAYLSAEDAKRISDQRALSSIGPAVPTEAFAPVKKSKNNSPHTGEPSSFQESRLRARIGMDYSGIHSTGSTAGSSREIGLSVQTDMTRIAGTHWNLQGYFRDRLTTNSQPDEQTIQDYLDRTYIIQLYYDNPNSKWTAGFGRLYLPWAASIDTIDGGYLGRKLGHGWTAGVFGGSTPDPTSWHYQPNQQMTGSFVNAEGGDYDSLHYSSTSGVALSLLKWQLDRPYLFFENEVSYNQYFSVYHSLIIDFPQGVSTGGIKTGGGISRSYLTFHLQPKRWIGFDVYHNYFRDVPTAATALIGTGTVDKVLYQGVNASVRIEPVRNFAIYTTLGHSDKTGDVHRSLNQMYGLTWNDIRRTGIRADFHYSKFDSPFARGDYRVLSLSRHLGNRMLWTAQFGSQSLSSTFTANNKAFFVDSSFDTNLGRHTFLQSGITFERGARLNYEQWYTSLGYRFDIKGPGK